MRRSDRGLLLPGETPLGVSWRIEGEHEERGGVVGRYVATGPQAGDPVPSAVLEGLTGDVVQRLLSGEVAPLAGRLRPPRAPLPRSAVPPETLRERWSAAESAARERPAEPQPAPTWWDRLLGLAWSRSR